MGEFVNRLISAIVGDCGWSVGELDGMGNSLINHIPQSSAYNNIYMRNMWVIR